MIIRKAVEEDVKTIMEVIDMAKQSLFERHVEQWQDGYPNEEVIMEDVRKEQSYVVEKEGKMAGTAVISLEKEHTYDKIVCGQWLTDNPSSYIVIHRIATHNGWKRKGIAGMLLKYAEDLAKRCGRKSVRIDTHPDNLVMQAWLKKNGFLFCGWVYLDSGSLRYAYEKVL